VDGHTGEEVLIRSNANDDALRGVGARGVDKRGVTRELGDAEGEDGASLDGAGGRGDFFGGRERGFGGVFHEVFGEGCGGPSVGRGVELVVGEKSGQAVGGVMDDGVKEHPVGFEVEAGAAGVGEGAFTNASDAGDEGFRVGVHVVGRGAWAGPKFFKAARREALRGLISARARVILHFQSAAVIVLNSAAGEGVADAKSSAPR
jgi:hypothetical protein